MLQNNKLSTINVVMLNDHSSYNNIILIFTH